MTKETYVFVVLTNPVEGREEEFNAWYTQQHVPDLLRIPGFVAAQRFELTETQRLKHYPHPYKYAALYEMETDDLAATCELMGEAAACGRMPSTNAIADARIGSIYKPMAPRQTEDDFK